MLKNEYHNLKLRCQFVRIGKRPWNLQVVFESMKSFTNRHIFLHSSSIHCSQYLKYLGKCESFKFLGGVLKGFQETSKFTHLTWTLHLDNSRTIQRRCSPMRIHLSDGKFEVVWFLFSSLALEFRLHKVWYCPLQLNKIFEILPY